MQGERFVPVDQTRIETSLEEQGNKTCLHCERVDGKAIYS